MASKIALAHFCLSLAVWAATAGVASSQQAGSTGEALPETRESTIGYPSVEAALKDLRGRPGVTFSTENGWTIATEASTFTIWSFAPPRHPAYPTAVKRRVVTESDGMVSLKMEVLCEASKQACDDVVREFQKLNAQIQRSYKQRKP
ncbi:MAG: molecular chaperone DnaJ [Proteobacteria bacterium]|nr:molecular chaperone DnaJ [Pseudomonadota bacterium]